MKKKIIALVLAAVLLAGALALVSCKKKVPEVEYTTVTRITFDAIASVEIIVNFQNNVVAVTPYNDAAEIILSGESFLKTTPDETVAKIAALAANAGYFAAVDSLKLSVSGEGEYVDVISEMIEDETEKALKKAGVEKAIEFVAPATVEELRQLNREVGYYSEEVLASIPDEDLIFAMAQCRVNAAALPDLDFSFAYYSGMDRMSLVHQKNGIAELVKGMGEAHDGAYSEYRAAFLEYEAAANAIDKYLFDNYLSETSEYRALKKAVREALADIESGRQAYDAAVAALEAKKAELVEGYNALIDDFAVEANKLTELETNFSQEIRTEYRAKVMDIFNAALEEEQYFMDTFVSGAEAAINAAKSLNEEFKTKLG